MQPLLRKNGLSRRPGVPYVARAMPNYRMPEHPERTATVVQLRNALSAARCSVELAGMETGDFVVRELLLAAIREIDRVAALARRLSP
jgi:hypothetical protein